jgi:pimeloyl-ACP methyl ester carboxylesterase
MPRRSFTALFVALSVATGACSLNDGSVKLRHETTGTVAWSPCSKVECGSLSVPLDYEHPNGPHITLALARLPARGKKIGVLFSNPGGPGASGVEFLREAPNVFPDEILKSFDIVSWDPRGVGASAPVRCIDNLDAFYAVDRDPHTAADVAKNVAAASGFIEACKKHSGSILPHLSTANSARDMDAIRAAIGEEKISYVGYSYGTLLGALYADQFPTRVRAMVLDGPIDPARSFAASTVDQAKSFDHDLDAFFAHCKASSSCAFARGNDPAVAYKDLTLTIAQEPIPGTVDGEARTLGPGELNIAVASGLYAGAAGYATLASALAKAGGGDAAEMLALSDTYTGRRKGGKYSSETAVLYATGCIDTPAPRSVAAVRHLADSADLVAPWFGAASVWLGLPCTLWPVAPVGKVGPIRAPGAPPIMVVGALYDPATPYPWAQALASGIDTGHLLTAGGTSHTSYRRGNACVDQHVDAYLLHLTVPAADPHCN